MVILKTWNLSGRVSACVSIRDKLLTIRLPEFEVMFCAEVKLSFLKISKRDFYNHKCLLIFMAVLPTVVSFLSVTLKSQ